MKRHNFRRSLALLLAALLTFSAETVPAAAQDAQPVMTPSSVSTGSCVQIGSNSTNCASITKQLTGTEAIKAIPYYISFDYHQSTDKISTYMYLLYLTNADGKEMLDIQNTGDATTLQLHYYAGGKDCWTKFSNVLKQDQWQNITVCAKSDTQFSVYLDGVLLKDDKGNDTFTFMNSGTASAVQIGDLSTAGANGYAYMDNFLVVQNGTATSSCDFESGKTLSDLGWQVKTDVDGAVAITSSQGRGSASLSGVTAVANQSTVFKPGEKKALDDAVKITGVLSTGTPAVNGMASSIVCKSADETVVSVSQENGQTYLNFQKSGSAVLTIDYTLLGVTKTVQMTANVSDQAASAVKIGTESTTEAWVKVNLAGDEAVKAAPYSISFDYHQSTSRVSTYMYLLYVSNADDKEMLDIQNTDTTTLQLHDSTGWTKFGSVLKQDQWQNITVCAKSDTQFSVYLDGVLLKDDKGKDTFTFMTSGTASIVRIGDLSPTGTNGYAYVDNFRVVQNGTATTQDTFDDSKTLADLGWAVKDAVLDTSMNCHQRVLKSVVATSRQAGYLTGSTIDPADAMTVGGTMDDETPAIIGLGSLSYESMDPSTAEITADGKIHFTKAGTASIKVNCAMFGTTCSCIVSYAVSDTQETTGYLISNTQIIIPKNGTLPLTFEETFNIGANKSVPKSEIAGFQITSSMPSVISVADSGDSVSLTALGSGSAEITLRYTLNGKTCSTSKTFKVLGNCLRTGSNATSYGHVRKPLFNTAEEIKADDYYVSFDYRYDSGANMQNFYVWSSYNSNPAYGSTGYVMPTIVQNGGYLYLAARKNYPMTQTLAPDVWHTITLHFNGQNLSAYLDGQAVDFGGASSVDTGVAIKLPDIGFLGDTSQASSVTGYAYYDNIRVTQNGKITTDDTFDDSSVDLKSEGWILSGENPYPSYAINMDAPSDMLDSVSIESKQTVFLANKAVKMSSAFTIKPVLANGYPAITSEGVMEYSSSDTSVMTISQKDGDYILNFLKEGKCQLIATYTQGGITKTGTVDLTVSDTLKPSKISISNSSDAMLVGDEVPLEFRAQYNDGSEDAVDIKQFTELNVQSSDPSIAVTGDAATGYKIKGVSAGSADITVTAKMSGETLTCAQKFYSRSITSVSLKPENEDFAVGDTQRLTVTALLSDGTSRTDVPFDSLNYTFSQPGCAEIDQYGQLHGLKACDSLTVTLSADYHGDVQTASCTVKVAASLDVKKSVSTYYTPQKVAAARENIGKYKWALTTRDTAVAKADDYLSKLTYADMWDGISSQSLPRSLAVNQTYGSLITGKYIDNWGIYPYTCSDSAVDWKVTDPSCGVAFPTNDFKAYYEGGLDENGNFDGSRAKAHNDDLVRAGGAGNLVNRYAVKGMSASEESTVRDAMAKAGKGKAEIDAMISTMKTDASWGVDDGFGYVDGKTGVRYNFIPYYAHWFSWYIGGFLAQARNSFTDAYLYTGQQKYADAAIVMLERIATVYGDMDLTKYSNITYPNGCDGRGKVVNSVWETTLANDIIKSYDAVFPAIATVGDGAAKFLKSKAKTGPDRIKLDFETGVLSVVFRDVKNALICGNDGMHQSTLALAAVVLDHYPETQEWLTWDFQSGISDGATTLTGGNLAKILVNSVDQNGLGNEGSLGYDAGWLSSLLLVADVLDGYGLPEGKPLGVANVGTDLYKNPKFKKMFYSMYPLLLNDIYIPNIGDTHQVGMPDDGCICSGTVRSQIQEAYQHYKDPALAQVIYLLNGSSSRGLKNDIFTQNPESIAQEVQDVIDKYGQLKLGNTLYGGTGIAVLRDGNRAASSVPSGIGYDFYNLDVTGSYVASGRTPTYKYLPTYYSSIRFWGSAVNDYITFKFDFEGDTSQNYHLFLQKPPATGAYGLYNICVNGKTVAANMNFSDDELMNADVGSIAGMLNKGANTITFKCTGASPVDASAFGLGVRTMTIFVPSGKKTETTGNTQRELWTTFGVNGKHDHNDALNLGLTAYGLDLLPDLGYPQYADEGYERRNWVDSTLSHNTVVVDGRQQNNNDNIGKPTHFDDTDFVKLFDVEDNHNYDSTSLYKRTSAMIAIDNASSYIVDLFHVKGGSKHEFSFHGEDGVVTTSGLTLSDPQPGTYAGPNSTFGTWDASLDPFNVGYYWLKNVQKQTNSFSANDQFSIDWQVKDVYNVLSKGLSTLTNTHVKLTMLGMSNDYSVSLADGKVPVKPGNPNNLKYVVVKRTGTNLSTTFTSVIEPYQDKSSIVSEELLPVYENNNAVDSQDVRAIKIVLKNGRTDYAVSSLDTKTYTVKDGGMQFQFSGFFGVYSLKDGKVVGKYLNDGTTLADLTNLSTGVTGTVTDFTKDLSDSNSITVRADQPVDAAGLAGKYIHIANGIALKNAVYKILSAAKLPNNNIQLNVGDVTTVRRWTNENDFSKGYDYLMAPGNTFTIPLSAVSFVKDQPADASITPSAVTYYKNNPSDVQLTKEDGSYTLNAVRNGGTELVSGRDYSIAGDRITIRQSYLNSLPAGNNTLTFDYSGGKDPQVTVTVINPSPASAPVKPLPVQLPADTGLGVKFQSDTTAPLSVDNGYTFKITSKDGKVPSFIVGTAGVFDVTLVKQDGNDYYFRLTAIGVPGSSAGIYIDGGARLLVATVGRNANAAACDTTCPINVENGKSYVFKITAKKKPDFEAGTPGVFRLEFLYQNGDNYYYRITAIGKSGQGCGFYLNGSQQSVSVATIR